MGKEQTAEVEDLERREDMLTGGDLIQWIVQFGRWNVQGCVAESQDMRDVLTYLRAEMVLEIVKATSFATVDSVWFEKIPSSAPWFIFVKCFLKIFYWKQ